jgi:hypothetical protein
MNRVQMLRAWHRDGCETREHARHTLRNGQIWILYHIHDPWGTKKFGHSFTLLIVIDGRTDIIIGSQVVDICLDRGFIGQNSIDTFERIMHSGCHDIRPERVAKISTPINNIGFTKGTPMPAAVKGSYEKPQVSNTDITNVRWYTTTYATIGTTTASSWLWLNGGKCPAIGERI